MRRMTILLLLPSIACCVQVQTSFGTIDGFEHDTERGIGTHVFLGIRYGKSPDGPKRFKRAEMVDAWAPSVVNATKFAAACIPFSDAFRLPNEQYSEDCLSMNIIKPAFSGTRLPVFFFIHGGGFEIGASNHLGYKRLAERVASEGIVVVTINYRLGPFGFLSLGGSFGNMGLWDQTLALKFLHQILHSFGGDASRITVGGHSAGSCAASALQFSPHANSLFSQAVLMSGSGLAEFSLSQAVVDESKNLAKELGCSAASTVEQLDCLREKSTEEIIQAVGRIGTTRKHTNILKFHPRFDGDFFPHPIEQLAKESPKKRTLSGVTSQESAIFILREELAILSGLVLPKEKWSSYSRDDLITFIETAVVTEHEHLDSATAFRRQLIEFYVEREEQMNNAHFYLLRFAELASDMQFLIPLFHEIRAKLVNDWPTYLYILEHAPKNSSRDQYPLNGTYHCDELGHFTDNNGFYPVRGDDQEYESFGSHFVSAFVNFIKHGDPSSSFSWPTVSVAQPFQHASISAKIRFHNEAYRAEAARLWLDIIPRVVPGDLLRNSRLPGAESSIVHTEF